MNSEAPILSSVEVAGFQADPPLIDFLDKYCIILPLLSILRSHVPVEMMNC